MPLATRAFWVIVHRWAGLTTALFLAVAGMTGMALAWEDALEAWTAPRLVLAAPPSPATPMRDPVALRDAALARHPGMAIDFLPLTVEPGRALRLRVSWATGMADPPAWDELFVDPYSGQELGHRHWGDIGEGRVNLLPFVYRLHYTLLLGGPGTLVMGVAALVWTFDCFVGFCLTLPRRVAGQRGSAALSRWKPAWLVRRGASRHKLTFDLHRAGGLWLWPVLLVFAISSVSFNLPQAYVPLLKLAGGTDDQAMLSTGRGSAPRGAHCMDFAEARQKGEVLARQVDARLIGDGASWLWHRPGAGLYVFGFTTRDDVADEGGGARLVFDDCTGALRSVALPQTAPPADRFTHWIQAFHMARVFGWPWRACVTLLGAGVTMLSVTGILIWTRKRSARLVGRDRTRRRADVAAS